MQAADQQAAQLLGDLLDEPAPGDNP